MGILEKILEKVTAIENALVSQKVSQEPVKNSNVVEIGIKPETETVKPVDSELDSNGNYWDESIHASTKTKTAKGIWTKRRGVSKEDYEAGLASQSSDFPETVPTVSAAPAVPTVPTVPAVPAAPAVPEIESVRSSVVAKINNLTNSYGVDYDKILKNILPNGVEDFTKLTEEQLKPIELQVRTWGDWLNVCDEESVVIEELGGNDALSGMRTIYSSYGGDTLSKIDPEALNVVHDLLKEYRAKWEAVQ